MGMRRDEMGEGRSSGWWNCGEMREGVSMVGDGG